MKDMKTAEISGYDVIGDIHGHADALRQLLAKLGYREVDGTFRHNNRQVIFVGDFVDRGPDQRESLRIARTMCEAGSARAVLGNHEFNAIGWVTPNDDGGFLRKHSDKNACQHAEFLNQLGDGSADYHAAIDWFRQLPVWLELPGLRVVHACWHEPSRAVLASYLDHNNCFTDDGLRAAHVHGSQAYVAAEILLKGPEQDLPDGNIFRDKEGHVRNGFRIPWWDRDVKTFKDAANKVGVRLDNLPDGNINTEFHYRHPTPVLFGHYWMQGQPTITHPTAACLDFSVAMDGHLTAYRWSGEAELLSQNLVYVDTQTP